MEVCTRLSTKMWGMSPELQFLQKNQYYVKPFSQLSQHRAHLFYWRCTFLEMCEKNSSFIFQKIVISYTSNSWALQFLANVTQTAVDTDALLGTNFSGGSFFAVVIFFYNSRSVTVRFNQSKSQCPRRLQWRHMSVSATVSFCVLSDSSREQWRSAAWINKISEPLDSPENTCSFHCLIMGVIDNK